MDTTSPESVQGLGHSKPKINWKYGFQQYGTALAMAVPFYPLFTLLLFGGEDS